MLVPVTATRIEAEDDAGLELQLLADCAQRRLDLLQRPLAGRERRLHGRQDLGCALVPRHSLPGLRIDLDRAEEERAERLELGQRRDLLLRQRRRPR